MKKRKLILTLVSLFSLIAVVACDVKNKDNSDLNEFEQAGTEDEVEYPTVNLTAYEGENYIFDDTISNKDGSVSYEIFVRSFYDTDNDGVGDFNGVRQKLPYLKDLGIKTVWLMPIMPSPSYHGYDVTDYYDVNPDYGTMSDFEMLLNDAKNHNIDIMIEDKTENINSVSSQIQVICFYANHNKNLKGENIYRAYSWYDVYYKYLIIKEKMKDEKN